MALELVGKLGKGSYGTIYGCLALGAAESGQELKPIGFVAVKVSAMLSCTWVSLLCSLRGSAPCGPSSMLQRRPGQRSSPMATSHTWHLSMGSCCVLLSPSSAMQTRSGTLCSWPRRLRRQQQAGQRQRSPSQTPQRRTQVRETNLRHTCKPEAQPVKPEKPPHGLSMTCRGQHVVCVLPWQQGWHMFHQAAGASRVKTTGQAPCMPAVTPQSPAATVR
jgi:hypothetical protein